MAGSPHHQLALARVLALLFKAQAHELLAQRRLDLHGPAPDLNHWVLPMASAVRPLLLELWRDGAQTVKAPPVRAAGAGHPPLLAQHPDVRHTIALKTGAGPQVLKATGAGAAARYHGRAALTSQVLSAVDAAALLLCRETLDTARGDLDYTLASLRRRLKRGLKEGVAMAVLVRRLRRLFTDPARVARIARTESARAHYAGQTMAAVESGVVRYKRWLFSPRACADCLAVGRRKRKLNDPYVVLPGGGPYARVMHPPLHPHCLCDQELLP